MRSTDTKKNRQHPQKADITQKVDNTILCLFPSLDYNRANVHAQTKKGMETLLKILDKATESSVTKYGLTQWKAKPRLGGQVAQNALNELKELRLLKSEKAKSEKGTPRNDFSLTPKGLLACLCFFHFQNKDKLGNQLQKQKYKASKLVFVMKLYNDTFVRGAKVNDTSSPVVAILRQMAKKGFNLELKSDDDIAEDLRLIEQDMFLESLNMNMLDSTGVMLLGLSQYDKKTQDAVYKHMKEATETFSDPNLTSQEKEQIMNVTKTSTENIALFLTSQEFAIFATHGINDHTFEDLAKNVLERISRDKDKAEVFEIFEDFWLVMREVLFEKLFDFFRCSSC